MRKVWRVRVFPRPDSGCKRKTEARGTMLDDGSMSVQAEATCKSSFCLTPNIPRRMRAGVHQGIEEAATTLDNEVCRNCPLERLKK